MLNPETSESAPIQGNPIPREMGRRKYTYHPVIFVLTFFSYAFFHMSRKTFSNVKTTISEEWTPSFHNATVCETKPDSIWNTRNMFSSPSAVEPYLGILDASFMISYAVGLFISGIVGDRLNMRYVLTFGMCSTAVMVFLFGCVLEWVHLYNKYLYVFLWIINGLLQSTGWPTVVAVMGNWFGKSSRGLVFGLWSACASVGNILGALMVSAVLDYGYQYAFLFTSAMLFAGGIINFFGLVTSPRELGLQAADEDAKGSTAAGDRGRYRDTSFTSLTPPLTDAMLDEEALLTVQEESDDDGQPTVEVSGGPRPAINFCTALLLPGVILYSLAYAFLKLVNYSFFFWLPYYLSNAYHWKETVADSISIWYDVGGIVGGTIGGFISDRFERRAIVVIPMLGLAIPSLFIYGNSPANLTINSFLMSVAGFFIGGVANLVSAAVAADLGNQGPIQGNTEALATVTGIIDGTGSVGAAIGQILVPVIQRALGWRAVFYLFMICTFLTGVCIFPLFVRELKDICSNYQYSWHRGLRRRRRSSQEDQAVWE
ncbi:sugar phosphate exchanger 3-like isoform X1 [Haliotis rufescens]|uniref:sugar phosphate exchanger 3-like isoform X1 n=1 Tax=Haliotis rufescens TaxID=6454 RepID=UPI00201F1F75|nr:sugar phosphate exchanger 3-like isoform X1 [Haliotis rufescens]